MNKYITCWSKVMAIKMQVDILQLFSQWAISTGEKGPKNFWGYFFYFHLKLWKVLTPPQLPAKNFSKTSRSKKKKISPSLKVTPCSIYQIDIAMSVVQQLDSLQLLHNSLTMQHRHASAVHPDDSRWWLIASTEGCRCHRHRLNCLSNPPHSNGFGRDIVRKSSFTKL